MCVLTEHKSSSALFNRTPTFLSRVIHQNHSKSNLMHSRLVTHIANNSYPQQSCILMICVTETLFYMNDFKMKYLKTNCTVQQFLFLLNVLFSFFPDPLLMSTHRDPSFCFLIQPVWLIRLVLSSPCCSCCQDCRNRPIKLWNLNPCALLYLCLSFPFSFTLFRWKTCCGHRKCICVRH